MSIPESINDLSVVPEENSPQGGENIGGTLDNYLRIFQAIMKRDLALKKAETADGTVFTPAGGLVAKNVQEAIVELINWGSPKVHSHSISDLTDFEITSKTSSDNLNDLNKDGIYAFPDGGVNAPSSSAIKVLNLISGGIRQQLALKANSHEIYIRSKVSTHDNTWLPWKRLDGVDWDEIRGKPEFEYGSNANGNWYKFIDGTAICTIDTKNYIQNIPHSYGSLYQSSWAWAFPLQFTSVPIALIGKSIHGTGASWGTILNGNNNYVNLRVFDVAARTSGYLFEWSAIAIGRWK